MIYMWPKEAGYVLSIDPATNLAGVSLWHNGVLVAWRVLDTANKKASVSWRLRQLVTLLDGFLNDHCDDSLSQVIAENTPRAPYVTMALGAILTHPRITCKFKNSHWIGSTTWKKYAKSLGAQGHLRTIKGVQALKETGWDFEKYPVDSDDVADSILIYRAWAAS
jgi:hypothetical protein